MPVRLDECVIPDLSLGGGRTLGQLDCADLFGERRGRETARLVSAITEVRRRLGEQDPVIHGTARASDYGAAAPQVQASLPPDAAAFIGRSKEMISIRAAVMGAAAPGGVWRSTRSGDAWSGQDRTGCARGPLLAGHFPDRQLFIDLHAHTPGHEPVRPEDALARLLAAVGADPQFVPADFDGRAGLWRDRMAGQRVVLVLDNAADSSQVAPLLPGAAGCVVLVTSRRHLGDLPGAVTQVPLDVLPRQEAADMFTRLAPRSTRDADRVKEVVGLAGFLPLAISLLARLFDQHQSWSLANLADETKARLLDVTAESRSIYAAFEVSYQFLDPGRQRFFRLLGVHPGAATDDYAAAALTGTSRSEAAGHLEALYREGVLTETACCRYGMHDLVRRYARDKAASTPADSQQAADRLLDYYQHAAALASERLARQTRPGPPPPVPDAFEFPVLEDAGRALAWARAERASLLACLDHAAGTGQHVRVISLTAGLAMVLWRDGPWADAVTRHAAAVDSARRTGDRLGEANALSDQGIVQRLTGEYPGAAKTLRQAMRTYRDLGDQLGQANVLRELGAMRGMTGKFAGAAKTLQKALGIYRDLGDQLGQANALRDLGTVRWLTGEYPGAAEVLQEALDIYRSTGNQHGEANALTDLGGVRQLTGDSPEAARALEQALSIYRAAGNRHGEANALTQLGTVRRETGKYSGAAQALEQALSIYRAAGNRHGEANSLTELGIVRRETGKYPGAAQALEQAMSIWHDLGSRHGEAETLNEQAALYQIRGDLALAQQRHRQAMRLARMISSAHNEARALAGLGRCAIADGNAARAEVLLRRAFQIFQRIGAAEARSVRADLNGLQNNVP